MGLPRRSTAPPPFLFFDHPPYLHMRLTARPLSGSHSVSVSIGAFQLHLLTSPCLNRMVAVASAAPVAFVPEETVIASMRYLVVHVGSSLQQRWRQRKA